jgi:hypothetical protein
MGLPRSEKARGRRTDERGPAADTDKKPKKKLDATAVWRGGAGSRSGSR